MKGPFIVADLKNALVEFLGPIFETLPKEDAQKILAMVHYEMQNRALVSFCNSVTGCDLKTGFPCYRNWGLLQPSPLDEQQTVWAMVQCDDGIVVFTVQEVVAEGENGEEQTGYQFFREVIRDWRQISGPIHHDALVKTLEGFMQAAEPAPACALCGEPCEACGAKDVRITVISGGNEPAPAPAPRTNGKAATA